MSKPRHTCKVYFGKDIRKFVLTGTTYALLVDEVLRRYNLDDLPSYTLKYEDEDGDRITIACDDDVKMALSVSSPARLWLEEESPPNRRKQQVERRRRDVVASEPAPVVPTATITYPNQQPRQIHPTLNAPIIYNQPQQIPESLGPLGPNVDASVGLTDQLADIREKQILLTMQQRNLKASIRREEHNQRILDRLAEKRRRAGKGGHWVGTPDNRNTRQSSSGGVYVPPHRAQKLSNSEAMYQRYGSKHTHNARNGPRQGRAHANTRAAPQHKGGRPKSVHHSRRCGQNRGTPENPIQRPQRRTKYGARMVEHVTVPDGIQFRGGVDFVKTWRMRNIGAEIWPEGVNVLLVSRDNVLNAPASTPLNIKTFPDQEVEVSIPMRAPIARGDYELFFKLALPSGRKFGPRLRIKITSNGVACDDDYLSESISDSDEAEAYLDEIARLEEMGFKCNKRAIRLLDEHEGNVPAVVKVLIARKLRKAGLSSKLSV